MDARSSESWSMMLGRFRQLLLSTYSRCIDHYEEHIRAERERRTEPTWSFCEYFVLQVLFFYLTLLYLWGGQAVTEMTSTSLEVRIRPALRHHYAYRLR